MHCMQWPLQIKNRALWRIFSNILIFLSLNIGFAASPALKSMVVEPAGGLLWQNARVPYVIHDGFLLEQQQAIQAAMALWEAETVIRFVRITPENQAQYPDYVLFQPEEGRTCTSSVGRQGRMQPLRLAPRCDTLMIAHELGHLIGLWHEHARLDRDDYVVVHWENIEDVHYHNFNRRTGEGQNHGPYDYDSIMHYSEMAFSQNGKPTLVPRQKGVKIGQRTHLSAGDITSVNALYAKYTKEEQ